MKELVVLSNGVPRQVTGCLESATAADLIYALAHANNQTGRFVLVAVEQKTGHEYFLRSGEVPEELLRNLAAQGIHHVQLEMRPAPVSEMSASVHGLPPSPSIRRPIPRSQSCSGSVRPPDYRPSSQTELHSFQSEKSLLPSDWEGANLKRADLEDLVLRQQVEIEKQKELLASLNQEIDDQLDQEYFQLSRQQKNLRKTLDNISTIDWESKKEAELAELDRIQTAVDTVAAALSNKARELQELERIEAQLTEMIRV